MFDSTFNLIKLCLFYGMVNIMTIIRSNDYKEKIHSNCGSTIFLLVITI